MSLLKASNSGCSTTDGVKINENPDSAVITPIPKKEESNVILPDKRKKAISNILRGKNRTRKQSFSKTNQDIHSPESDVDKNKDNNSEDEITLIKVIPNEEKKKKKTFIYVGRSKNGSCQRLESQRSRGD